MASLKVPGAQPVAGLRRLREQPMVRHEGPRAQPVAGPKDPMVQPVARHEGSRAQPVERFMRGCVPMVGLRGPGAHLAARLRNPKGVAHGGHCH